MVEFKDWQNSRWLPSSSWVRMNEWSFFVLMLGTNIGKCEWDWEEKLLWLNPRWPNSSWQNSRWLPLSGSVRMNEFESDWISLSHSQSGVRVFLWIWEKITRCLNPRWQCLNWQHSRWLPSSIWVRMNEWSLFCANGGNWSPRWLPIMAESRWWNSSWQNSRWLYQESEWMSEFFLCKMAESKMAEFRMAAINYSWVRMNEWRFLLYKLAESKMADVL